MTNTVVIPVTAASEQMPVSDLLAYHAAKDPTRPAVTFDGVTISRVELDARSNRKARQLAALGVGQDDVVTLALPNGIEFYETLFAIWKVGATPNSVSSRLPDAELRAILELAKPRVVIGSENLHLSGWNFLAAGSTPSLELSADALPSKYPKHWKIMTSGGSTGRPKLIVDHTPGLFSPAAPPLLQFVNDTMLNPGPVYHNSPFVTTSYCLFNGGHVVEMGKFDPLRALELIERHRVAWVNFVPTMMHRIWRLPPEQRDAFDLSSLRVVFHMASACPVWLKERWIEWLGPERIFELYGGTEGQGFTIITGTEWLAHKGSVGRIVGESKLRVLNEAGENCARGEVGDIYFLPVGGRNSTYHYVGATAKALGDWESLGDLGYLDEDDYLYLVDRRTDLIVAGGANIYPAEIEAALDEHPDVRSSIVIGLPDEDLGQKVHAIVQLSPDAENRVDATALAGFLGTKLARYKVPRSFEFTREFLRDDAGKARRSRMREERVKTA